MNRVLITGSRTWDDPVSIGVALHEYQVKSGLRAHELTLVSGNCPKGADLMAEEAAKRLGWNIERHPANWERDGKAAGFIRNQQMVDAGADICFAFIHDGSKGATHTANAAERAGIPVRRYIR